MHLLMQEQEAQKFGGQVAARALTAVSTTK